jgi:hypothetical protein
MWRNSLILCRKDVSSSSKDVILWQGDTIEYQTVAPAFKKSMFYHPDLVTNTNSLSNGDLLLIKHINNRKGP